MKKQPKAMKNDKPKRNNHILKTLLPNRPESGYNQMNWHNCDKMSSVGEMSGGGGS